MRPPVLALSRLALHVPRLAGHLQRALSRTGWAPGRAASTVAGARARGELSREELPREYSSRPVSAVALFVCDFVSTPGTTKILAIKRGKEPGKGTWSLPGGGVTLGEKCVVAVRL